MYAGGNLAAYLRLPLGVACRCGATCHLQTAPSCAAGGNLAAYLRLTYPRQFDAALASSAVVKFLMPSIPFLKTKYDAYKARLAASTCKFHAAINVDPAHCLAAPWSRS